jgi:N-methylhydantoinase B
VTTKVLEAPRQVELKMDPIKFEVMRSAFVAAADEMGVALRKAAYSTNIKFAPWGLFGGGSGASSKYILNPDDEARELPSKITLRLRPNSVISYRTPGGGGYGPALERDPQLVLSDVINGKITPGRAHDVYGVVLDLENGLVNDDATANLRKRMKDSA